VIKAVKMVLYGFGVISLLFWIYIAWWMI